MQDYQIVQNLYNHIQATDRPRAMAQWHCSSIAKCPREQYLMRTAAPAVQAPTAPKIFRWAVGHLIEQAIRPVLQALMPDLLSNQRFTSEQLDLTGEYDNYDPATKTIWEVKSVHPGALRQRDLRPYLRDDQPYLHHQWQEHAYVLLLQEQGITVERIVYLYIALDGRMVAYETPVREDILQDVRDRLNLLNQAWQDSVLPDCICDQTDHPLYNCSMRWCDYKTDWNCCQVAVGKEQNGKALQRT